MPLDFQQVDMPKQEMICKSSHKHHKQGHKEDKIIDRIQFLEYLIYSLYANTKYDDIDPGTQVLIQYFQEEISILLDKLDKYSKGYFQDHDKEKRDYARDNEYASRDERYYNRYHEYDTGYKYK